MSLWKTDLTVEMLNSRSKDTLVGLIGIEFLEVGDDYITARMPVDQRTKQPLGILHGGASVVLAETLGSVAARFSLDPKKKGIVGLDINANHIRPVSEGWVTGITRPVHVGNATQVWEIKIFNEKEQLVCISRLTVANIDAAPASGAP